MAQGMLALNRQLTDGTGYDAHWWMCLIGKYIGKHSRPSENPLHGFTESNLWLRDLADEIWTNVKLHHDLTKIDENILCSKLMSLILTVWTCRIIRAKAYDPRRPIALRRIMLERANKYHHALLDCMVDESDDQLFCPEQDWETPYKQDAMDGTYV